MRSTGWWRGGCPGAELDAIAGPVLVVAEHHLIEAGEGFADQELVVSRSVVVARVEQRDARVEGRVDRREALRPIRRTVQVGHAHASEAHRRDARAVGAERASDHVSPLLSRAASPTSERRA